MMLTRRDFLEQGVKTTCLLTVTLVKWPGVGVLDALAAEKVAEVPVIWIATGSCTGCSVSLLNSASPNIQEILLDRILPGKHLSLGFHATVMAASGDRAMEALDEAARRHKGAYVLVVDGATATKEAGLYCGVGELRGVERTGYDAVRDLGRNALAVLSVGTCSSFGGIPAAPPNPTGAVSVMEIFKREGIKTPVVNIPGCPPHPDWIVGTIATILLGGLGALKVDQHGRPAPFYSKCIHDNCPYRGHFERGEFAQQFGDHGCLIKLGCKGPITYADCPIRKWNGGTSWCVQAGHPCIGCCEPEFPFEGSLFTPVQPAQLDFPAAYPAAGRPNKSEAARNLYVTVGLIGAGGFLAGAGVALAAKKLNPKSAGHGRPSAECDRDVKHSAAGQGEETPHRQGP